ncbi:unnamed protein product [Bursaphelenchus okinawaensis]|uniref:ABC1 atypical kinase-like domain-containing protein n=1 Tax=Bursaphelenchus okinawaensis TaxID=465554 RepID=A0A811KQ95_9BILA|nr:unnamed protein product [Bursaphelenchus okinawaensis]CAG9107361.1 unnamed protein product [Bursaphelenchus okinawaensis]
MSSPGGWQKDISAILTTIQLLAKSQLGYEGRQVGEKLTKKGLETLIAAGNVQRPFDDPHYGQRQFTFEKETQDFLNETKKILDKNVKPVLDQAKTQAESIVRPLAKSVGVDNVQKPAVNSTFNPIPAGLTPEEERVLIFEAKRVGVDVKKPPVVPHNIHLQHSHPIHRDQKDYRPSLPKEYRVNLNYNNKNLSKSQERKVPSSRLARVYNFGALAVGLGTGAAAELGRRTVGIKGDQQVENPFLTAANAERVVETLCRVRGAALKLGQMLSIQDETMIPRYWLDIFDRVRHSADFMPIKQVKQQLAAELGPEWRTLFREFDEKPFAAASIGQVHKAVSLDGTKLAVKVQYPGVAEGIDSDIQNLVSVLKFGGLFPKGMYLEEFVNVARRELKAECDYEREADAMIRMRDHLADDDSFFIPGVFPNLSSKRILTTEFVEGKPVDECVDEPQEVRDYISAKFMELCLKEVFLFRFMQTDPNWSNFFFGLHPKTGESRLILLDFGAAREYPKEFVDKYMKILHGAYNQDREAMLHHSREIGFLTGFEDKVMEKAHVDSISILAETLVAREPYDFGRQDVTARIQKLVPVMLEHRLKAPPEEVYSLHRKLSGAYLLATKLKAKVACGPLFHEISEKYEFDSKTATAV